jgi:hypothetical protein
MGLAIAFTDRNDRAMHPSQVARNPTILTQRVKGRPWSKSDAAAATLPRKEEKTISDKRTELDYALICPLSMSPTFL